MRPPFPGSDLRGGVQEDALADGTCPHSGVSPRVRLRTVGHPASQQDLSSGNRGCFRRSPPAVHPSGSGALVVESAMRQPAELIRISRLRLWWNHPRAQSPPRVFHHRPSQRTFGAGAVIEEITSRESRGRHLAACIKQNLEFRLFAVGQSLRLAFSYR